MTNLFEYLRGWLPDLFTIIVSAVAALAFLNSSQGLFSRGLKYSLRVAVIGLPRSGKTTLITVVFNDIMSGRLARYASVSGTETVDRLQGNLQRMMRGINIGPTEDRDVFAYRYTVKRDILFLKRRYDVEIADFPGEYSQDIAENLVDQQKPEGLFRREFFSWVTQADRYIFVIDAASYIWRLRTSEVAAREYVDHVEILLKSSVLYLKQELLDENIYRRKAMVVFTKCDALYLPPEHDPDEVKYNEPRIVEQVRDPAAAAQAREFREVMDRSFRPILKFMDNNFSSLSVVYHSSLVPKEPFRNGNEQVVRFASP